MPGAVVVELDRERRAVHPERSQDRSGEPTGSTAAPAASSARTRCCRTRRARGRQGRSRRRSRARSPRAGAARASTKAAPSVGCPANGISATGLKIRMRAVPPSSAGRTKTVSENPISARAPASSRVDPARVGEDRELVAGQRRVGEDVGEDVAVRAPAGYSPRSDSTHFCVVLPRPVLADVAGRDPAQRVSRGGVDDGEVEMTDEEPYRGERQRLVHDAGAVEEEAVVALAEPEEEPRDGEEQRKSGGEQRVHLLAGVELPCGALRPRSQRRSPASIASISRQSSARRRRSPATTTSTIASAHATAAERWRFLTRFRRATASAAPEGRGQPGREHREEPGRVHPVQRPLGPAEAADRPARAAAQRPLEPPTHASSS